MTTQKERILGGDPCAARDTELAAGALCAAVTPSVPGSTGTVSASAAPIRQARLARAAVAATFLANGALFANIVPRYPQIKADLDLGNALFGTSLAAFPLGALLAGLFAATAIRRFRSSRVASLGIVLFTLATLAVPIAPNWVAFAVVMCLVGAVDAVVDVAQNAHGLRVQRLYQRSVVNSFHGVWSIGAVLGGLMGSAAAGLRIPLSQHLAVSALLFSAVALIASRFLLPGPEESERVVEARDAGSAENAGRRILTRHAVRMLAALGVLAACGAFVEDAGASWGALYLTDDLHAGAATAGLAFVTLQVAMILGRLTGDRAVDRFGQRAVVRVGAALAALGMATALAFPSVPNVLAGFALAGLGVATLVPAAMHTADKLPGLPPGTGLTAVSWLLRCGILLSPSLIGLVADHAGLRVGLFSVVLAGNVAFLLARASPAEPAPAAPVTCSVPPGTAITHVASADATVTPKRMSRQGTGVHAPMTPGTSCCSP